jgi:hypothetical protein
MKKLLILAFFLNLAFDAAAQHYNKYCNSVFSFCVDIPGNFNRKGDSKTGSGQYFTSKDGASLSVYAIPNETNEALKQRFEREQTALTMDMTVANTTQLPIIDKAELLENAFTIQYQNQNITTFVYRKLENATWKNIELQFPMAKGKDYADKAKRMIESLK